MPARIDYLICRTAPAQIHGVVYFRGAFSVVMAHRQRVLTPLSSGFRGEATLYEEHAAHLIAEMLNAFGPAAGVPDAVLWQALPASITLTQAGA
jgi:hypothetical protein